MDPDSHKIFDVDGKNLNTKPIKIDEKVCICYGTTELKGESIPNNCVIGEKSLIIGNSYKKIQLFQVILPKCIKDFNSWK